MRPLPSKYIRVFRTYPNHANHPNDPNDPNNPNRYEPFERALHGLEACSKCGLHQVSDHHGPSLCSVCAREPHVMDPFFDVCVREPITACLV